MVPWVRNMGQYSANIAAIYELFCVAQSIRDSVCTWENKGAIIFKVIVKYFGTLFIATLFHCNQLAQSVFFFCNLWHFFDNSQFIWLLFFHHSLHSLTNNAGYVPCGIGNNSIPSWVVVNFFLTTINQILHTQRKNCMRSVFGEKIWQVVSKHFADIFFYLTALR